MLYVVKEIHPLDEYPRKGRGPVVYVRFADVSVMDWLQARRTFPVKEVMPALEEQMKELGILYSGPKWDPKAGCSACPCSPGFRFEQYICPPPADGGPDYRYGAYITLQLVDATAEELYQIAPVSRYDEIIAKDVENHIGAGI